MTGTSTAGTASLVPRIAIITPTCNRRDLVLRAMASLQRQTMEDFEHIIVDDGSTDGTGEAVAALSDDRVTYIRMPSRRGANVARNLALERVRAPVTTFLDSDDLFLPNRLETTLGIFERNPDLNVVISSFLTIRGDRLIANHNPFVLLAARQLEKAVAAQVIYMPGSSITARTGSLREIGGFDPGLRRFQDGDLLMRLAHRNGALLSDVVDWEKHDLHDSITRSEDPITAYAMLLSHNRRYADEFPVLVRYMVARSVLAEIMAFRPGSSWQKFRRTRAEPFRYSAAGLLAAYFKGKRLRRKLRQEIADMPPPDLL